MGLAFTDVRPEAGLFPALTTSRNPLPGQKYCAPPHGSLARHLRTVEHQKPGL